jgi:hypothetical protein
MVTDLSLFRVQTSVDLSGLERRIDFRLPSFASTFQCRVSIKTRLTDRYLEGKPIKTRLTDRYLEGQNQSKPG